MSTPTTWKCGVCEDVHTGIPFSYGASAPYYWSTTLADDPASVLEQDYCIMKAEHFFVYGVVQIPVIDADQMFSWTAWVSLSRANMERTLDVWTTEGRESEPPYFGWFSTELGIAYGGRSTLSLKAHVITRPVGQRPLIHLELTDHPLSVETHQGITMHRVQRIAELMMHP